MPGFAADDTVLSRCDILGVETGSSAAKGGSDFAVAGIFYLFYTGGKIRQRLILRHNRYKMLAV